MEPFSGFQTRSRNTPIPNAFFSSVLPLIDDEGELRVSLHLFWRLAWKKGYPRFVALAQLASDLDLISSLGKGKETALEELQGALSKAVARGTFLHLALDRNGSTDHLYLLNTDANRRAIERVRRSEIDLGAIPKVETLPEVREHHDIFSLYETNIGVLSPLIADELKEAEETYPKEWVVEAFREAQRLNKRNWRYVARILENWTTQGRADGESRRRTRKAPAGAGSPAERSRAERKGTNRRREDIVRRSWP